MANYGELIKSNNLVLVDFYATWCGPCQALGPILADVSKEMEGKVKIVKVDIDKNARVADKLNVRGVPTLVLYRRGEQVWRQSGVVPGSELSRIINQYT